MKRFPILVLTAVLFNPVMAQTAKEEIKKNTRLSASNYLAYPGPQQKPTPAPMGYKPFYISHYGRHGSRNLISQKEFSYPYESLKRAERDGKLTPFGKDVLQRITIIREEARNRLGELTPLGAEQHKQIARRLFERYPEIFGGETHVDAKSTTVIRCILSMENALQQLLQLNPKLRITHDASMHEMYYMNQTDTALWNRKMIAPACDVYHDFCKRHDTSDKVLGRLVSDPDYMKQEMNATRMNFYLFRLASNLQSMELRKKLTLYDVFDDTDLYQNWVRENAWWYIAFGACPLNGGTQPFSQRNLLRTIIQQADSCIALPRPNVTLRYGHETMILPLCCLLDLNGYGVAITDLEQIDRKGWRNYRIFPMASNIQFVFYRKDSLDKDVIFKVLLNEDEATLPLKSDMAPYYRWSDFREYYLKKLDTFQEK